MLILLRGNSGSGKSTTARLLRDKIVQQSPAQKVAIIEQDYFRRVVLKEKEKDGGNNIGLLEQTVRYCLDYNYIVIAEGIFVAKRYGEMLRQLLSYSDENHAFYFDVPLHETLRRHASKPNAQEFGEKEMRKWYKEHDTLAFTTEIILGENLKQAQIIDKILAEAKLL